MRKEFDEASKKLHKTFKDRDILLSSKAIVSVEEAGSHWLVIDRANEKQHTIWKENGKLYAAEGEIKVYTATLAYTLLGREFHYTLIDWLIIILVVIVVYYAIFGVLSYLCTYVMTWVSQRILFDLRNKVFTHLQSLSMQFYESQGTGQIISRVREDVASLRNLATETTIRIVTDAVTFILMLGLMLYWNWKLTSLLPADLPTNHWKLSHLHSTAASNVASMAAQVGGHCNGDVRSGRGGKGRQGFSSGTLP